MGRKMEMKKLNSEYAKLPLKARDWELSRSFVPGDGPLDAKVMIIGQAPGRNEDVERKPFIGASGKFLTELIGLAGLDRKSIYISSVVQFFPPKNRVPTRREIELCRPFIMGQIEIVDPKVILLLGSVACKAILNLEKVASIRGTHVKKGGRTYLISLHPAAGVRIRKNMPVMREDFAGFRKVLLSVL